MLFCKAVRSLGFFTGQLQLLVTMPQKQINHIYPLNASSIYFATKTCEGLKPQRNKQIVYFSSVNNVQVLFSVKFYSNTLNKKSRSQTLIFTPAKLTKLRLHVSLRVPLTSIKELQRLLQRARSMLST